MLFIYTGDIGKFYSSPTEHRSAVDHQLQHLSSEHEIYERILFFMYRGADKSLPRSGRAQANVSVRMSWISFGALPCRGKKTWWQLASRCCWNRALPWHASELVSFMVRLRTYQHPGTLQGTRLLHNKIAESFYYLLLVFYRKLFY